MGWSSGQGLAHDPRHGAGGEQPHQVVLQRQVEAAGAGVALAPGPAPELVVDAAALVALGAEHVQPAQRPHLVALGRALVLVLLVELLVPGLALGGVEQVALGQGVEAGQAVGVAAEDDVDAPPGHVGGDGDGVQPPGLGDDHRLPLVLLGVQDRVGDAPLVEQAGQPLGLLDRHRADQHRLAGLVALGDVVDDGVELGLLGLVDLVGVVDPDHRAVGGDGHDGQVVGVGELGRLGLGGAGHARQLVVHAEVVLQGDRGEGLVLVLDPDPLLGLDGLVQPLRPAPTLQDAAGELVDDLDLAVLDDVVDVALVQLLGPQGGRQLVDVVGRQLVVEVVDAEGPLDLVDPGLEGDDGLLLLVDLVVGVAHQDPDDAGELVIEGGGVLHLAADDERRAGLVDEDRVDLVDDGEGVAPLHHVLAGHGHVVAEVVEAELVVGAVGDVGPVGLALQERVLVGGQHHADGEAQPLVDLAHPLGVAPGQVVVDGDEVHAPAAHAVEVDGQGGDEGLALAGLHLGDPAEVQGGPAHQLDVVVALADDPPGRLPDHREGLEQDVVEGVLDLVGLGPGQLLAELHGLVAQLLVGEGLHLRLEGVDVRNKGAQRLELLALARTEDLGEDGHGTSLPVGPARLGAGS